MRYCSLGAATFSLTLKTVLLQEALTKGDREKLIYVPCIIPDQESRPDYLATVDVDPESATYSQVGAHAMPQT